MKKNTWKHWQKGITLLELVVVLGIIAVLSGATIGTARGLQRRTLHNASLALQSDMRHAQRMALIEGRRWRIAFDDVYHRYSVGHERSVLDTAAQPPWIYLPSGVEFSYLPRLNSEFLPRGTLSGGGFTIYLRNRQYEQRLTILPVTGRVRVWDVERLTE